MNDWTFKDGMEELDQCFDHRCKEGMGKLFWSRLRHFDDTDFTKAVRALTLECQRFPALAQIYAACSQARQERIRHEKGNEADEPVAASNGVRCPTCGADNAEDREDVPTIIMFEDGRPYRYHCGRCNASFKGTEPDHSEDYWREKNRVALARQEAAAATQARSDRAAAKIDLSEWVKPAEPLNAETVITEPTPDLEPAEELF